MGLNVICPETGHDLGFSYGGFETIRSLISAMCGSEWHEHYDKILSTPKETRTEEWYAAYDRRTKEFTDRNEPDYRVADFLLQQDAHGHIGCDACEKILEITSMPGDNPPSPDDGPVLYQLERFREILQECVDHRCGMYWS